MDATAFTRALKQDDLGGYGARTVASCVDGLLALVATIPVLVLYDRWRPFTDVNEMAAVLTGVLMVLYTVYVTVMTASPARATLGKLAMGLRVVDLDGRRISLWRSLVRFVILQILGPVGAASAPFTPHRQAVHDLATNTLVTTRDALPR